MRSPLGARSRWQRLGVAAGSVAVAAVAIAIALITELPGASQGASTRQVASGGATVRYRDLVSTDTESGTLGYASPETVFNRLSGTITSLPKVGQVIAPGQTLYRVSGNPVVLFDGSVPAYRDLTSGDSDGSDVLELNRDLRTLGVDPEHLIALNDAWQTATTDAVERWQASLGETQTGTVTLGQIVFLPGAQRISTVDTALGSTGGAAGTSGTGAASGSSSNASTTALAPRAELVGLTKPAPTVTVAVTGTAPCPETGLGIQPGAATGATTNPTNTTATAPPTAPATTTTPAPTTAAASPPPRSGQCSGTRGSSSGSGQNSKASSPSSEAALLALLKAETLELKKSLSGSGSASRSSASAPGATGSATGRAGATSTASAARTTTSAPRTTTSAAGASSGAGTGSSTSGSGSAGTAQAILQTTSNQLVVTVDLDATKQSEAVVGERVSVQLPAGDVVGGKVTQVSSVAQSSTSSSSSSSGGGSTASSTPTATIPVTIKVLGRQRLNGLDQAAVSVSFVQQEARHVLSVPVTALLATAGGGYAVQEVAAPHRLAAVTPGLFAAGFVQISGAQVYSGLSVTDSQG